jgi:hypothetical protein
MIRSCILLLFLCSYSVSVPFVTAFNGVSSLTIRTRNNYNAVVRKQQVGMILVPPFFIHPCYSSRRSSSNSNSRCRAHPMLKMRMISSLLQYDDLEQEIQTEISNSMSSAGTAVTHTDHADHDTNRRNDMMGKSFTKGMMTVVLMMTLLFGHEPSFSTFTVASAYDTTDYASETIQNVLQRLKDNYGNVEGTVATYEDIVAIITEGKGVGGSINYQGVQLDRGYVSDEDTAIYNPGLTLLTESEKQRIVSALVQSKNRNQQNENTWNIDAQAGFDYIREKLDPFHTYELKGYLTFVPYYIAVLYVGVLAIQQFARDWFAPAYIVGVFALVAPALVLILIGPQ